MHTSSSLLLVLDVILYSSWRPWGSITCWIQPRTGDLIFDVNDLYMKFLPQRFNFKSFRVVGLTIFSGDGGLQNDIHITIGMDFTFVDFTNV